MKITDLKFNHQDTVIGRLLDLSSMRKYYENDVIPFYSQMNKFEEKEYQELYNECIEDINSKKQYVIENKDNFEQILNQYNHTIESFLNIV